MTALSLDVSRPTAPNAARPGSPQVERAPISNENYRFSFGVHTITTTQVIVKLYDHSIFGCTETLESKPFVKSKRVTVEVPGDTRLVLVNIKTDKEYPAVAMFRAPFDKLSDIKAQIRALTDTCKHLSVTTTEEITLSSKNIVDSKPALLSDALKRVEQAIKEEAIEDGRIACTTMDTFIKEEARKKEENVVGVAISEFLENKESNKDCPWEHLISSEGILKLTLKDGETYFPNCYAFPYTIHLEGKPSELKNKDAVVKVLKSVHSKNQDEVEKETGIRVSHAITV